MEYVASRQAMQVEQRIFILPFDGAFINFNMWWELPTSLAHVGIKKLRPWDVARWIQLF